MSRVAFVKLPTAFDREPQRSERLAMRNERQAANRVESLRRRDAAQVRIALDELRLRADPDGLSRTDGIHRWDGRSGLERDRSDRARGGVGVAERTHELNSQTVLVHEPKRCARRIDGLVQMINERLEDLFTRDRFRDRRRDLGESRVPSGRSLRPMRSGAASVHVGGRLYFWRARAVAPSSTVFGRSHAAGMVTREISGRPPRVNAR